jgi:hypothetical protein
VEVGVFLDARQRKPPWFATSESAAKYVANCPTEATPEVRKLSGELSLPPLFAGENKCSYGD